VVPSGSWPAALQHFTGSKEHNTALRSRAKSLGLKMNEYGVYDASGTALPLDDEASVYRAVGLAWIPPESAKRTARSRLPLRARFPCWWSG